jgi:hypothetical protein
MSPGLVNYSEHSDLGQIVNAIIRELKKLPEIKTFPNGQNGVSSNRETFLSASQFSQQQYFPIPPFIPELESLSRNQIKNLSENEDVLHQFVEELPQAEAASKDVQNHMDNVEKIASKLLLLCLANILLTVNMQSILILNIGSVSDLKETWNVKRQKILEHYEMLNKLKQDWDSLNTQHHNLSQRYIPNNIEVKKFSL